MANPTSRAAGPDQMLMIRASWLYRPSLRSKKLGRIWGNGPDEGSEAAASSGETVDGYSKGLDDPARLRELQESLFH